MCGLECGLRSSAERMAKLTALGVKRLVKPGRYGDGGGLWLQVRDAERRAWLFRYKLHGKARAMGLGALADLPLAEAREAATAARKLVRAGVDPIEHRNAKRAAAKADNVATTFREVAGRYVKAHEGGWRNEKHRAQWASTLESYAYPVIGDVPVRAVDTAAVLRVLEPIWNEKAETASHLRGRIEVILDFAKSRGLRTGENPARWRGHLSHNLAKPTKLRRRRHHPALPWIRVGAFVAGLRSREDTTARALEFLILTAARSGEVLGVTWREIDLDGAAWNVPGTRMKAGRDHRVPLSAAALDVLHKMQPGAEGPDSYVFPGRKDSKPLSTMALDMLLRRMNEPDKASAADAPPRWADRHGEAVVPHGFRSTFRDWVGEASAHGTDLAEAALAHIIKDQTEAAYARGDLFEKRRELMQDWADWCATVPI